MKIRFKYSVTDTQQTDSELKNIMDYQVYRLLRKEVFSYNVYYRGNDCKKKLYHINASRLQEVIIEFLGHVYNAEIALIVVIQFVLFASKTQL